METYRSDLESDLVESQKYRIRAFLIPKLGNHASSSDMAIEFINVNKLTESERGNYDRGVAFIKGVENPFKFRPKKIVEILTKKIPDFNMSLHTKCWKFYEARPRESIRDFKGEYSGFLEGFEGYLYTQQWVNFLTEELQDSSKIELIRQQSD